MSEAVSRIMDKAAVADRRALFAALQAALGCVIDAQYDTPRNFGDPFDAIERALDVGAPHGSREHIASLEKPSR